MAEELFAYQRVAPPPGPARPKTSRRPRRRRRQTQPGGNSEEENVEEQDPVDYWTREAMNGCDLARCDADLLPAVIENLRAARDSLLTDGYADDSCVADEALKEARRVHKANLVNSATSSIRDELRARHEEAEEALAELLETSAYQEQRMNELMVRENALLLDRQTHEMEQLADEWESPAKFRGYNRLSPELRLLREQADRLLRLKKYDDFRRVEAKADRLEKSETERSHRAMEGDFAEAVRILQEKQRAEREKQDKAQQNRRNEYFAARDFDVAVARKRIEKIEKEMEMADDPEKVWALHHRHDFEMPPPVARAGVPIGKRSIVAQEFNTLKTLPPLKTGRSSKRIIRHSERNFKFNKNYVFI